MVKCDVFDTDERKHFLYGDNKFDLAVLSHVVEHVKHPRELLNYAGRAARYVFIQVPLEDNHWLNKDYDGEEHINVYSYQTIRWLIQTSDLKIIHHKITIPSCSVYQQQYEPEYTRLKDDIKYMSAKLAQQIFDWRATLFFDCYNSSILCELRC